MNRNRRILFLLLINLFMAFLALYILDMLQIIDYKQILSRVPFLKQSYAMKEEDPFLIQKLELEKKQELLDEQLRNFKQDRSMLDDEERNLTNQLEDIQKQRDDVKNMIDNFNKQRSEEESYSNKIDAIATQIENMPPNSAVNILSKEDDLMIIDILKRIDEKAKAAGGQSTVPYLLSLMDPEQSARIQRKMLQ